MAPPTRRRAAPRESGEENEPNRPQYEGDFFEFVSSTWYALVLSGVTVFTVSHIISLPKYEP
jgi:hypothetical protein